MKEKNEKTQNGSNCGHVTFKNFYGKRKNQLGKPKVKAIVALHTIGFLDEFRYV